MLRLQGVGNRPFQTNGFRRPPPQPSLRLKRYHPSYVVIFQSFRGFTCPLYPQVSEWYSDNSCIPHTTMPPIQSAVQAQALATVARVRSEVFQTVYNPLNIRNGEKYLRKKLRGPAIMHYYAPELSYRTLNAQTPYNAYANWEGTSEPHFKAQAIEDYATAAQQEKWGQSSVLARIKAGEKPAGEEAAENQAEGSSSAVAAAMEAEGSGAPTMRWRSSGQQLLNRDEILGAGFTEVERIPGAGWIDDGAERLRREEVQIRRLMGKGPPKKGMCRVGLYSQALTVPRRGQAVSDEEEEVVCWRRAPSGFFDIRHFVHLAFDIMSMRLLHIWRVIAGRGTSTTGGRIAI